MNLLRAYDTRANVFGIQQANVIVESAPKVDAGRRFGARIDLQFGQATETVQGGAANEPRPDVYRHIWQAYGTYVFPVGRGLQTDFGKFASMLGYETNYAKDNNNFSRAYLFNFLPFYHSGLRVTLPVSDKVTAMYMLTNGVQQTEDFNNFKSNHFAAIIKPNAKVTWTTNYYFGQEQPDPSTGSASRAWSPRASSPAPGGPEWTRTARRATTSGRFLQPPGLIEMQSPRHEEGPQRGDDEAPRRAEALEPEVGRIVEDGEDEILPVDVHSAPVVREARRKKIPAIRFGQVEPEQHQHAEKDVKLPQHLQIEKRVAEDVSREIAAAGNVGRPDEHDLLNDSIHNQLQDAFADRPRAVLVDLEIGNLVVRPDESLEVNDGKQTDGEIGNEQKVPRQTR